MLCLAGANGLGKSTFLSAINYAITGVVPLPSRSFKSAGEYFQDAVRFTKEFFTGRIRSEDRDTAAISVQFSIGETEFFITRGIFDVLALREFRIEGPQGGQYGALLPEAKHAAYAEAVAEAVGLPTFEQFVFLQHFVLTFDESRNLLFWDDRALNQAIYLSFGGDYSEAVRAETIRRDMERADSRVRNLQYQATGVMNRLRDIEKALGIAAEGTDDTLTIQYEGLLRARSERLQQIERAELHLGDLELKRAESAAQVVSLRTEYARAFSAHLSVHAGPTDHPIIRSLLEESRCGFCGSSDPPGLDEVRAKLLSAHCPLCDSAVSITDRRSAADRLQHLDEKLADSKRQLHRASEEVDRTSRAVHEAQAELGELDTTIQRFELEHASVVNSVRTKQVTLSAEIEQSLQRMREEHKILRGKRQEALNLRNKKKAELRTIRSKVERGYAEAEAQFVPLFQKLAELFLGMELDVRLESRASTDVALVVEIRRTQRREHHQLSESQRFFVDIALRMAFAQYLSDSAAPATLFIDTPEGSLDIAYERKAGDMFAAFVKGGHDIIMTANINTSRLLLALARECGREFMSLHRMTDWTELSDVQLEDEAEFESAYESIEAAMEARGA